MFIGVKHVKTYQKVSEKLSFKKLKIQYAPIFKILFLLNKFSVHSKKKSMHTLGNTDLFKQEKLY